MATAIHSSPLIPPFPGFGICNAASPDTCPYGGADTHMVTNYLPPELQEQLHEVQEALRTGKGDALTKVGITLRQMNDAIEKAQGTAGNRFIFRLEGEAAKTPVMNKYYRNAIRDSARIMKTSESMQKSLAWMQNRTESKLYNNALAKFQQKYGEEEGEARLNAFLEQRTADLEAEQITGKPAKENRRKAVALEYFRRSHMDSNMGNGGEGNDRRYYDPVNDEHAAKMKRPETYEGRLESKLEAAVYLPDKQVHGFYTTGTGKNMQLHEATVDVDEYAKNQKIRAQYEKNIKDATKRVNMILEVSDNDRMRSADGIGTVQTLKHDGRIVTIEYNHETLDTAKLDAMPQEEREKFLDVSEKKLGVAGLRQALADGEITQEQYDQVTNVSTVIDTMSISGVEEAQKSVGIKFRDIPDNRSINDLHDTRATINDVARSLAESATAFENEVGMTRAEFNKKMDNETKALKNGLATTYAPELNCFVGGALDTNVIQSTSERLASANVLKNVLGEALTDKLINGYGYRTTEYSVEKVRQSTSPEVFKDLVYSSVTISEMSEADAQKKAEREAKKAERERIKAEKEAAKQA